MTQAKKKKRFKYFVDKPFQTKFILNFIVLVLISGVVSLGFILYVDSQKFSKGVLFEELVKDFYKSTDLSTESIKIRNIIVRSESIGTDLKNKLLSDIDGYVRRLTYVENDIKEAIKLRKSLIERISLTSGMSIFVVLNDAVKEGRLNADATNNIDVRTEIGRWRIDIERGIQECEFGVAEEALKKMILLLSEDKDVKVVVDFRKDFETYKSLVISSYNFLTNVPGFVRSIESDLLSLASRKPLDEALVSSLSLSLSRFKSIVESIKGYDSVLYYETRTYGKKAYNLLDLYWRPILALSILQIVLITVFGLFFSHRIAGPVHRIKKELREIAEGKLPVTHEIRLRKKDFLLDIAREINNTLKSIAERHNIR